MNLKALFKTFRPPFLVLTPICVCLGFATALMSGAVVDKFILSLVFLGALSAHISVNTFNEYLDFKSGLDFKTQKTPFSGGSGALVEYPEIAEHVKAAAYITLSIVIAIGLYFIALRGMTIALIGFLGVLLVVTYTQWLNRIPILCLLASGAGFGLLMVMGTHWVFTDQYAVKNFLIALIPFFLVNNLLLLNQYPDIESDASVGRKTFPIVFGVQNSNIVYALFALAAYSLIIYLIATHTLPLLAVIALLPMGLSLLALKGAVKYAENISQAPHYMAANVAATLLTPLLLGLVILFS